MATTADFLKSEGRMFGFPPLSSRGLGEGQGLGGHFTHPDDMMTSSQRIMDVNQRMNGYSIDGILGHGRLGPNSLKDMDNIYGNALSPGLHAGTMSPGGYIHANHHGHQMSHHRHPTTAISPVTANGSNNNNNINKLRHNGDGLGGSVNPYQPSTPTASPNTPTAHSNNGMNGHMNSLNASAGL
ncbi:unnamed protein product, partial [Lymnaea stagnalis]